MIRGLPYDAEIEYLESTGTQWIDTGIVPDNNTGFTVSAMAISSVVNSRILGVYETISGIQERFAAVVRSIQFQYYFGWGNAYNFTSSDSNFMTRRVMELNFLNSRSMTFDGVVVSSNLPILTTFTTSAWLFGNRGTAELAAQRIYQCQMSSGNEIVRDFIPVRVGTVGYMYDRVSKRLFGNSGTGAFVLGPDKAVLILPLYRYGASRFGKIGAGQRMMTPFVVPTSLDDLAAVVRAFGSNREAARALLCPQDSMVEIPDTWTAESGTVYSNPQQVVDVDFMENEAGETLLYAICVPKYASTVTLAFDQRNQEPSVETTAQPGVDYYGFAAPHDPAHAYASAECCTHDGALYRASAAIAANTAWDSSKWALQGYISADGTIPVYSEEATYPANSIVRYTSTALGFTAMFKNSAAITTVGPFDPAKWALFAVDAAEASFIEQTYSEGDALDYSGYAALMRTDLKVSSGNGVKNALRYGSNNWERSAYRQYWNNESDTPHGWFHQTHPGQIAPFSNIGHTSNTANSTNYGYKHGCSAELLRNVHAVKVPTWPNYVTDGPNNTSTIYHTLDTFWPPSGKQWVGNANANEGEVFPVLLWQYIRALKAAGCKVAPYDATAEGEVGTVYVDVSNGQFYTYRPDLTGSTKYSNFTNDDGIWFRSYRDRTIEEVATNADRGSDASKVYFVISTQKMWRVNGSSWTDTSHDWYTYNAVGKPTGDVSPLNGARRSFSVTNHSSAVYVRLRSAHRGYSNNAWTCYSHGHAYYNAAAYGYAGRPACAIR